MIEKNKNLKGFNTFMIPASADYFARVKNQKILEEILLSQEWKESKKHLVLGGGSNMLFVINYDGFILKNEIKGIEIIEENKNEVLVKVGAGENWHHFVMWSTERDLWGIENLAYIPGTVGAAPVQNIGAYGAEVSSSIDKVVYISLKGGEKKEIQKEACAFSYRDSFFKKNPGKYIITSVYFRLQKNGKAQLSYGKVKEFLLEKNIKYPKPKDIASIITEIRKTKLPEPGEVGMAGSFFKNPIISKEKFEKLKIKFPEIKYFSLENEMIKIPAGWILDKLGYRGFYDGNVGNYEKHALVVTHNGRGTGQEVWNHVQNIIKKVHEIFEINLEPEVNIIK